MWTGLHIFRHIRKVGQRTEALQRRHWTVSAGVWLAWMYLKSALCVQL